MRTFSLFCTFFSPSTFTSFLAPVILLFGIIFLFLVLCFPFNFIVNGYSSNTSSFSFYCICVFSYFHYFFFVLLVVGIVQYVCTKFDLKENSFSSSSLKRSYVHQSTTMSQFLGVGIHWNCSFSARWNQNSMCIIHLLFLFTIYSRIQETYIVIHEKTRIRKTWIAKNTQRIKL